MPIYLIETNGFLKGQSGSRTQWSPYSCFSAGEGKKKIKTTASSFGPTKSGKITRLMKTLANDPILLLSRHENEYPRQEKNFFFRTEIWWWGVSRELKWGLSSECRSRHPSVGCLPAGECERMSHVQCPEIEIKLKAAEGIQASCQPPTGNPSQAQKMPLTPSASLAAWRISG